MYNNLDFDKILPFRNVSEPYTNTPGFEDIPGYRLSLISADEKFQVYCGSVMFTQAQTQALTDLINGDKTLLQTIMRPEFKDIDLEGTKFELNPWWPEIDTVNPEDRRCAINFGVFTHLREDLRGDAYELAKYICAKLNGIDPFQPEEPVLLEKDQEENDFVNLPEEILGKNDGPFCFGSFIMPFRPSQGDIVDAVGTKILWFTGKLTEKALNRIANLLNGDPDTVKFPAGTFIQDNVHTDMYEINKTSVLMSFASTELDENLNHLPIATDDILAALQEDETEKNPADEA